MEFTQQICSKSALPTPAHIFLGKCFVFIMRLSSSSSSRRRLLSNSACWMITCSSDINSTSMDVLACTVNIDTPKDAMTKQAISSYKQLCFDSDSFYPFRLSNFLYIASIFSEVAKLGSLFCFIVA